MKTYYFISNRSLHSQKIFKVSAICVQAIQFISNAKDVDVYAYSFVDDAYYLIIRMRAGCHVDTFIMRFEHMLMRLYSRLCKDQTFEFRATGIKTIVYEQELMNATNHVYYTPERSDRVMDARLEYPWRYSSLKSFELE